MELKLLTEEIRTCIVAILQERGMTRRKIAMDLGVHYETIRKLEAGLTEAPRFDVVAGIIKRAGRSIDSFMGIDATHTQREQHANVLEPASQQAPGSDDVTRALARTVNYLLSNASNYAAEHSLSVPASTSLKAPAPENRQDLLAIAMTIIDRLMKDDGSQNQAIGEGEHRKIA